MRSKQKVCSHVAQHRRNDNTLTGSDEEAANKFHRFFTSVFVKEDDKDGPKIDFVGISKSTNSMLEFNICVEDVCKKLIEMKDDKSQGPDEIHHLVLKKMAEIVALLLKLIRSMLSNKLPLEWKNVISPIFKKGSKSVLGNYRLVSFTAVP